MSKKQKNLTKTETILKEMGVEEQKKTPDNKGHKGVLNYKSPTLQVQAEVWIKTLKKDRALDKAQNLIRRNKEGDRLVWAMIDENGNVIKRKQVGYAVEGSDHIVSDIRYYAKDEQGKEKLVKPYERSLILNLDAEKGSISKADLPLYLGGETKLMRIWAKNLNMIKQVCEDIEKQGEKLPYCPIVLQNGFRQYRAIALPMKQTGEGGEELFNLCLLATRDKVSKKEFFGTPEVQYEEDGETLETLGDGFED
jgi:hypothetical protein